MGADIDGEAEYDYSGTAVSMSADGNIVAIGAHSNDGATETESRIGHVRVYEYKSDGWVQVGVDIDGEAAGDKSGASVSISADGSLVAIGSQMNAGVNGSASGHVRVYKFDRGTSEPTTSEPITTTEAPDVDCEGTFSSCSILCELAADRAFTITKAKSGNGLECPTAEDCKPEDGACEEPTSSPTTSEPTSTTIALTTNCVRILTGIGANNDGHIKVLYVKSDSTVVELVAQKNFKKGATVYERCLGSAFDRLQVTSSNSNAWAGTFEYRAVNTGTYQKMSCSDCTTGTGAAGTIGVDGDGAHGIGAKVCVSRTCNIVRTSSYINYNCQVGQGEVE